MKNTIGLLAITTLLIAAGGPQSYLHSQRAMYVCGPVSKIEHDSIDSLGGNVYFDFHPELAEKSIAKGNQNWLREGKLNYFTSYLINSSDSVFTAKRQDGSLMMIQEALDKKGIWRPIEYWVPSGCGNSYFFPLQLEPNEYVVVPIRKYKGKFSTKVRLRMLQGDKVLISKPFNTTIDEGLFNKMNSQIGGILYRGKALYFED